MRHNLLFSILLSAFLLAPAAQGSTVWECADFSLDSMIDGKCGTYDSAPGQLTSTIECLGTHNPNWFYIDIIGTCGSSMTSNYLQGSRIVYSGTITSNTKCFCRIVSPFSSAWILNEEFSPTTALQCAQGCGDACAAALLDSSGNSTQEGLMSSLYR